MDNDPWTIPDFLRLSDEDRRAGWAKHKPVKPKKELRAPWYLPKGMDDTARKLLKEQEAAREAKKAERLAYLRSLKSNGSNGQ